MRRRNFLKNSLLSAGAVYAGQTASMAHGEEKLQNQSPGEKVCLSNRHFNLEYDLGMGRACLFQADGSPLLLNATAAAVFPRGLALASDSNYVRQARVLSSNDSVIPGEQLIITCSDRNRAVDLELRLTLWDDHAGVIFEVVLTNVSGKEIQIRHSEPLRALLSEKAGCPFAASEQWTRTGQILTNGYMYYDPGRLLQADSYAHQDFTSYWNAAFHRPDTLQTLVIGYLENHDAEGQVVAGWDMDRGWPRGQAAFNLTTRSLYNQYFALKPGASISSGRALLLLSPDPFSGLETYAETSGLLQGVRLNPIINGWCSWFYTHTTATEEEQLRNAEFIAKYLKPYGIELDLPHLTWKQYTRNFNSAAPAMAKRYYFHKRTWINDADHLGLRLLTPSQAQSMVSLIALSGGTMISGDRLTELDPMRLEILKKVLPTYGEAARPLDLFERDFPEIFFLPVHKDFESWWLLGYFNYDENATASRDFDLTSLGLASAKTYLIYEFWSQLLVAETSRYVKLLFGPSMVNLLSIREMRGVPQVLGTDRHYTQGGVELEKSNWDSTSETHSGTALGAGGTSWKLAIYVPTGYVWDEDRPDLFHDYRGFSGVSYEPNILRANLNFSDSGRLDWTFRFRQS